MFFCNFQNLTTESRWHIFEKTEGGGCWPSNIHPDFWKEVFLDLGTPKLELGGGFKDLLYSSRKFWEIIQFDLRIFFKWVGFSNHQLETSNHPFKHLYLQELWSAGGNFGGPLDSHRKFCQVLSGSHPPQEGPVGVTQPQKDLGVGCVKRKHYANHLLPIFIFF